MLTNENRSLCAFIRSRASETSDHEKRIFDSFRPFVQSKLEARTCKVCGKYFSTLQFLTAHKKLHSQSFDINWKKAEPEEIKLRIRQQRLAAIRASEALAIIAYVEDEEDAEWHKLEELDNDGIEIPNENDAENTFVMNIENALQISSTEHWFSINFSLFYYYLFFSFTDVRF